MSVFRITKSGFVGNVSGSVTGSLLGNASTATTASSVAWTGVSGKPSTYPASAHNHSGNNLVPATVATTGNITAGGKLSVKGTAIELASGSTTTGSVNGAIIQVGAPSLNIRLSYNSAQNAFESPIDILAPNINSATASISQSGTVGV